MKSLDLNLSQKILVLVTVPIVFMIGFVTTLAYLQKQAEEEIWRERHAKAVIAECNGLMHNIIDSGLYMYLFQRTSKRSFLDRFQEISRDIPVQLRSLKLMLCDSPGGDRCASELDQAASGVTTLLQQAQDLLASDLGTKLSKKTDADMIAASTDMLSCLRKFIRDQQLYEQSNPEKEAQLRVMVMRCLFSGVLLSVVIAVLLAQFFNRATTARLRVLVENTRRVASGQELRNRLEGSDEIAQLDKVFHDMAGALSETSRRKQELVQMVTHDLRTPLTSISAALRILGAGVAGELPKQAAEQVAIAGRNAESLLSLINDLLDIERLNSGSSIPVEIRPVEAALVIEDALETVNALSAEKSIKIDFRTADLLLPADHRRLCQVLTNLLSNAIKFSPADSVVTIEVEKLETDVEFRVIDSGRGVPESARATIFERFTQVKKEDADRGRGTGLGLAICKAIVEAHGGTIGVASQEGKGSTFWFRIPTRAGSAGESL